MKKILVIDKDPDWLFAMECFLKRQGYVVATAGAYQEGLLLLGGCRPDLIFLDICPGDPEGGLLCRKITADATFGHIPVILSSSDKAVLEAYRDYGAAACLKKPFKLTALRVVLRLYGKQE